MLHEHTLTIFRSNRTQMHHWLRFNLRWSGPVSRIYSDILRCQLQKKTLKHSFLPVYSNWSHITAAWNSLHMIPACFPADVWSFDIYVLVMEPFCVTVRHQNPPFASASINIIFHRAPGQWPAGHFKFRLSFKDHSFCIAHDGIVITQRMHSHSSRGREARHRGVCHCLTMLSYW